MLIEFTINFQSFQCFIYHYTLNLDSFEVIIKQIKKNFYKQIFTNNNESSKYLSKVL